MKKLLKVLSYFGVTLLSVFGLGITPSSANISHDAALKAIKETTPLYLQASAKVVHQGGQVSYILADHESHYSHESHESHYSHESHQSHYSGYSGD